MRFTRLACRFAGACICAAAATAQTGHLAAAPASALSGWTADEPLAFEVLSAGRVAVLDELGYRISPFLGLPEGQIAGPLCPRTLAFDSAEVHPSTGVATGGTCIAGGAAATRYLLRVADTAVDQCYRVVEDMNVLPRFAGGRANLLQVWVRWTPPAAERIVVIVTTFENFNSTCGVPPDPASGFLSSVVFESTTALSTGLYLIQIDLCSTPAFWLTLPADGSGAFEIVLGRDYDETANPPTFIAPTSATFARWGTEAGRPGWQTSRAWVDHAPVDGLLTASECVILTPLPPPAAACGITDVGVGAAFWASSSCLRGDANCDGSITNFDINFFVAGLLANQAEYLALGGSQACFDQRACWGDLNGLNGFNNFDIDPFVNCLLSLPPSGSPCP